MFRMRDPQLTAAIATMLDHVLQLEQALDKIRGAVVPALDGAPGNAVLSPAYRRTM